MTEVNENRSREKDIRMGTSAHSEVSERIHKKRGNTNTFIIMDAQWAGYFPVANTASRMMFGWHPIHLKDLQLEPNLKVWLTLSLL